MIESKDIIKAFEMHLLDNRDCELCPYGPAKYKCDMKLLNDVLELIKNQQAKIEKLKQENAFIIKQSFEENQTNATAIKAEFEQQRRTAEYIKRLEAEIERLKEKCIEDDWLLNDRIAESVNTVRKAHLKYENALEEQLKTAKTEAYKEVFNKLRKGLKWLPLTVMNERFIAEGQINDLEKELTERKEDEGK